MSAFDGLTLLGPVAYAGKEGCEDVRCRRMVERHDDGTFTVGPCMGWHCSYCDQPCSSQGHRCDAAEAILGEARRIAAAAAVPNEPKEEA